MAVAPTGAIYKALEFDGVSSRTYGVYITGEAVYNAPERDVEMITIPGRNGSFALDNGRFENIEVSYPAGIFADTEADFRQAISDFRNFLCSRKGYVRLQDEYNPNEYRMAVYKSGLEVDPAMLKAGEFEITFDCKPQRWLTSGESAVSVTSGDTLTNPTLFESSPLLEVDGIGTINFNGYEIEIENAQLGPITIHDATTTTATTSFSNDVLQLRVSSLEIGDPITLPKIVATNTATANADVSRFVSFTQTASPTGMTILEASIRDRQIIFSYEIDNINLVYGTPKAVETIGQVTYTLEILKVGGGTVTQIMGPTVKMEYDGAETLTLRFQYQEFSNCSYVLQKSISSITAVSSQSINGHPTYIDCDLGECYKIENDSVVSLNKYVDLGSDLPVLASGVNAITFDNTITDLKIVPRWWKI